MPGILDSRKGRTQGFTRWQVSRGAGRDCGPFHARPGWREEGEPQAALGVERGLKVLIQNLVKGALGLIPVPGSPGRE